MVNFRQVLALLPSRKGQVLPKLREIEMSERIESKTLRLDAHRRLAAESLKCCPLCGAVNAMSNAECFVCRWHGEFDHDPYHVEEGLDELLLRCPELVDAMLDTEIPQVKWHHRVVRFFQNLFRRRGHLDLRV